MKDKHLFRGVTLLLAAALTPVLFAQKIGGFDVSNALIPTSAIMGGGPPRDGIPSIDRPEFINPDDARFMRSGDLVVSLTFGGETRAYPLRILVWHEIVNDTIGGQPVAVTYCPLCGTSMVFDRRYDDRELTFGVSGLLFQSDVLMYDRQTESLWSQLGLKSVAGPKAGTELKWLPSEHMTWKAWREKFPGGQVLSTRTGHNRNYSTQPYGGYENNPDTMFPVPQKRRELGNKEWVAGIIVNGRPKAYQLRAVKNPEWRDDTVGGTAIRFRYDSDTRHFSVERADNGEAIPAVQAYWFAWQAFYPETELMSSSRR